MSVAGLVILAVVCVVVGVVGFVLGAVSEGRAASWGLTQTILVALDETNGAMDQVARARHVARAITGGDPDDLSTLDELDHVKKPGTKP